MWTLSARIRAVHRGVRESAVSQAGSGCYGLRAVPPPSRGVRDDQAPDQCPDARYRGSAPPLHQCGDPSPGRGAPDRARRGRLRIRRPGQPLRRGHGGAVGRRAWLRRCRADRRGQGATRPAALLPPVRRANPRAGDRAGREDQGPLPGADARGCSRLLVRQRGQRHPGQADLVHEQCARQAREEEDHRPQEGLSRGHAGRRLDDGDPAQPRLVRPALRLRQAHDHAALLA